MQKDPAAVAAPMNRARVETTSPPAVAAFFLAFARACSCLQRN